MRFRGILVLAMLLNSTMSQPSIADRSGCYMLTEGTRDSSACYQINRKQRAECDATWKPDGSTNATCKRAADDRSARCVRECSDQSR